MSGFYRFSHWIFFIVALGTVARYVVLAVREMSMRESLRATSRDAAQAESRLRVWRRSFGRKLWFQLVGVPLLILGALLAASRYD